MADYPNQSDDMNSVIDSQGMSINHNDIQSQLEIDWLIFVLLISRGFAVIFRCRSRDYFKDMDWNDIELIFWEEGVRFV